MGKVARANAVFSGGGVAGVAFVGAVQEAEQHGYEWHSLAGTSAGAVMASLLASGYTSAELEEIMRGMDFTQLLDEGWEDRLSRSVLRLLKFVPKIGPYAPYAFGIMKGLGIYEGQSFERLMKAYLARKGISTYGDLAMPGQACRTGHDYRLHVIATDLTARRMLILPEDARHFGIDPDDLSVALSIRMSMSIPVFFEPVRLHNAITGQDHVIVDGALLSNYPVWLFDVAGSESNGHPTIGFCLQGPEPDGLGHPQPGANSTQRIDDLGALMRAMWATWFSSLDKNYVIRRHMGLTILIDTLGVKATDFNLTESQATALIRSGREAARACLNQWSLKEHARPRWELAGGRTATALLQGTGTQ
jgi:NTE family protein